MFGWFRPSCPVTPPQKAWIERRLAWLARAFGPDRLRKTEVILPTPDYFPEPYGGTEADVRVLFNRVCGYMGVAPERLDLEFFRGEKDGPTRAVGVYVPGRRETVRIRESQFDDPPALVATMAHELAHALLLGDGRIAPEEPDHERVTDLLTVFLGLGIFGANSVIRDSYQRRPLWYAWQISRQGYLSEAEYGYAQAVFAWARGEEEPEWVEHLRPNVRAVVRAGLRYLRKTGDCLFDLERLHEGPAAGREQRLDRLLEQLGSRFSGARVAALWDLREMCRGALAAEGALVQALGDADPFVRVEAARALAALGPGASAAVEPLITAALSDVEAEVRVRAVGALAAIGQQPEAVIPVLVNLLREEHRGLRVQAIQALRAFGPAAAPAVPALVRVLDEPEEIAEEVLQTLTALGPAAAAADPALLDLLANDHARTLHDSAGKTLRAIRAQAPS